MSLFKKRMGQLKEYSDYKKQETFLTSKIVKKYKEKTKHSNEYEKFKQSLYARLDVIFKRGNTTVVIKPKMQYIELYEQLIYDEEFLRHYTCEVKPGNQVVIQSVVIQ